MDELIVQQYIQDLCKKNQLLYSNKKIRMSPDIEIRVKIDKKSIYFYEYIEDSFFNYCSVNYTINGLYRCYNLIEKYKDLDELEKAIDYCFSSILEDYKKAFKI